MGWLYDVFFMLSFVSLGGSLRSTIVYVRLREPAPWIAGGVALTLINFSCAVYWASCIIGPA